MMKEFGSDFHSIDNFNGSANLGKIFHNATFLADGRQGLILIILQEDFKRLWVPEYFCYEVLNSIVDYTKIDLVYYKDFPGLEKHEYLQQLPFQKGDALLIMNYFGMSNIIKDSSIPVPVIEDHSHDILSHWALYSNADWCIASLRKSLPLAEGGMVWSPIGKKITKEISTSCENEKLAALRWMAMDMKALYLQSSNTIDEEVELKEKFRNLYMDTEESFSDVAISLIDNRSLETLKKLDIRAWYDKKKKNWIKLISLLNNNIEFLKPIYDCSTPFSLVLKTKDLNMRDKLRFELIRNRVYPAVLWHVPEFCSDEVRSVSDRLLSVHCDGRYSDSEMEELAYIINKVYISI